MMLVIKDFKSLSIKELYVSVSMKRRVLKVLNKLIKIAKRKFKIEILKRCGLMQSKNKLSFKS